MPGARVLLVAERGSEREFAGCHAGRRARRPISSSSAARTRAGRSRCSTSALRALQGGARLIAMQGNAWWLAADGPRLDSGSYVRALAYAAGSGRA